MKPERCCIYNIPNAGESEQAKCPKCGTVWYLVKSADGKREYSRIERKS